MSHTGIPVTKHLFGLYKSVSWQKKWSLSLTPLLPITKYMHAFFFAFPPSWVSMQLAPINLITKLQNWGKWRVSNLSQFIWDIPVTVSMSYQKEKKPTL